jgi:alkylhydroperoxidase family enzyme
MALEKEKKDDMVEAVLNDWRTAPVDAKLRATLGFLEKLTLTPGDVRPVDVEPMRAAGVSDAAIEDAIHACVLFNIYDRMADSLKFHLPGPAGMAASGRSLLKRGYLL